MLVESVAGGARKCGGPRTEGICLETIGDQMSSRSVTLCPGVTKERDSTPLLITRGHFSKEPEKSEIAYLKYYWRHDAS